MLVYLSASTGPKRISLVRCLKLQIRMRQVSPIWHWARGSWDTPTKQSQHAKRQSSMPLDANHANHAFQHSFRSSISTRRRPRSSLENTERLLGRLGT
jgi:hypothetical protein